MEVPDWIARARPTNATIDVGFLISDTFYYGPENSFTKEQWQTLREPLYRPKIVFYRNYALTSMLDGTPAELIAYYSDVVRLMTKHGKHWKGQSSYFWLRPIIYSPDVFEISFPWYDTWDETMPLLNSLESTGNGEIFSDLEQGGEVKMIALDDRLFIRQGDFDTKGERECVSCDRSQLLKQVAPLRARCERLLAELRTALGEDHWSRR